MRSLGTSAAILLVYGAASVSGRSLRTNPGSTNALEQISGGNLFEGDIVVTDKQLIADGYTKAAVERAKNAGALLPSRDENNRQLAVSSNRAIRWTQTNGVAYVPYSFASPRLGTHTFSAEDRTNIQKWMKDLENQLESVIVFRPYRAGDPNWIEFISIHKRGCSSPVGMQGRKQNIQLEYPGCMDRAVVIHELLHAVGPLYHEQSRPDRDFHVSMNLDNVEPEKRFNFERRTDINSMGSPYDLDSIMHYGKYFFAIDRAKPTLWSTKDPNHPIGTAQNPSSSDIDQVLRNYRGTSPTRPPTSTPPPTPRATPPPTPRPVPPGRRCTPRTPCGPGQGECQDARDCLQNPKQTCIHFDPRVQIPGLPKSVCYYSFN